MLLAWIVGARTVETVTLHANGKPPAVPDIAGDLERTTAVVRRLSGRMKLLSNPADALYSGVKHALLHAESGRPVDHVVGGALEAAHTALDQQLHAASTQLSKQIGMPAAALRTRSGWNAALLHDGQTTGVDLIDDLPGTLTVLAVRELVELTETRRSMRSKELYQKMLAAWDTTRVSGASFDAVVDAAGVRRADLAEIGWAFISLEGRKHVNLIWHQANKLQRSYPDREASELLTWGWLGLRTALRNYNPNLGFAFSTYAVTRIVGAIRDGVRAENPVPKRLGTLARTVASVETELAQSLGRTPTLTEIGAYLDLEASQLAILRRTKTPASIEEIIAGLDRSGGNEPAWLADTDHTDINALSHIDAATISRALDMLPVEEAQAIRLLILEDRNPTEARQIAGVTARQLRQRKERALHALRDQLAELDPYT